MVWFSWGPVVVAWIDMARKLGIVRIIGTTEIELNVDGNAWVRQLYSETTLQSNLYYELYSSGLDISLTEKKKKKKKKFDGKLLMLLNKW